MVGASDLWVTGAAGLDFATVMYGTGAGRQRWASVLHSTSDSDSDARQVALGHQGTVVITGGVRDDFATVVYSAANGHRRSLRTFPGAGIALAINQVSGDVIVAGASSRSASRGNYTTIACRGCHFILRRCS